MTTGREPRAHLEPMVWGWFITTDLQTGVHTVKSLIVAVDTAGCDRLDQCVCTGGTGADGNDDEAGVDVRDVQVQTGGRKLLAALA